MNKFTNKQDQINFLNILASGIAEALGGNVSEPASLERDWSFKLNIPGTELWVRFSNHDGRLEVSHHLPKSADGRTESGRDYLTYDERKAGTTVLSIGCSAEKSAEKIAADIKRRLLPGCIEITKRWADAEVKRAEHKATSATAAKRVADSIGTVAIPNWRDKDVYQIALPENLDKSSVHGGITVSGNSVNFEVRYLNPAQALKLAEFLATL